MENYREYYRVDFKEREYGCWVCGDEYDTYEDAKSRYDDKVQAYKNYSDNKGVQLIKLTEEVLEEVESECPYLIGDYVEVIKDCPLKGLKGQIHNFNEYDETMTMVIDCEITFKCKFEDVKVCK